MPHIPQDIPMPSMQALTVLRNGLPVQIRQHAPTPTPDMTVEFMITRILEAEIAVHAMEADDYMVDPLEPVDDIGMGEPVYEPGPAFEDPIPAMPVQAVPAQEAGVEVEADDQDDQDAADDVEIPEDPPVDPPIIDISSDDDDDDDDDDDNDDDDDGGDDEELEPEAGHGGWLDEAEDFEDDPEEFPDDDGDDDSGDDISGISIEIIV